MWWDSQTLNIKACAFTYFTLVWASSVQHDPIKCIGVSSKMTPIAQGAFPLIKDQNITPKVSSGYIYAPLHQIVFILYYKRPWLQRLCMNINLETSTFVLNAHKAGCSVSLTGKEALATYWDIPPQAPLSAHPEPKPSRLSEQFSGIWLLFLSFWIPHIACFSFLLAKIPFCSCLVELDEYKPNN